ncbi:MAG: GumC family protein [Planctomycetota bacterium]
MATHHEIVPSDPTNVQASRVPPGTVIEHHDGGWPGMAVGAVPVNGLGVVDYMHAIRRHWFVACLLGLICAAAIGAGIWFGYGPQYESTAYLRVNALPEHVVFANNMRGDPLSEFDIYKNTQLNLIKSRFVLETALSRPEVERLGVRQRERDPAVWLADKLSVRFPGRAEIMEISMRSHDPEEATAIVQAVVDTYLNDIVEVERARRNEQLKKANDVFNDKNEAIRQKRQQVQQMASTIGTFDKEALSIKQQLAMQQFAQFQGELSRVRVELGRARAELKGSEALLASLETMPISPFEVDSEVRQDPVYKAIAEELTWKRMDLLYTQASVAPNAKSAHMDRFRTDLERVQEQYEAMQNQFREGIREMKRSEIDQERRRQEVQVAMLADQESELAKEVEDKRQQVDKLAASTIELEMARSELEQLEGMLKTVADEREKLEIELDSPERVVKLRDPQLPQFEFMPAVRYALTALGMLGAFFVPVGLIIWGDTRRQRINSADDVSLRLGVPVAGTMPIMPAQVARRLASQTTGFRNWRTRVMESTDGVMARLLRNAVPGQSRVVLVTSSIAGEGKTTVATQLAMSLARNGRRTVLVDFNLRRPALDKVFRLPHEPGVADVLRGEGPATQFVHQRSNDEPAVITAGRWDRPALAALAQGAAQRVFDQLREQYDFIVVDSSPVLPVADTRFVSQHVDVVLLSVFRDLSTEPKVLAAKDILEAFGTQKLEAVVTGAADHLRDRDLGFDSQLKA